MDIEEFKQKIIDSSNGFKIPLSDGTYIIYNHSSKIGIIERLKVIKEETTAYFTEGLEVTYYQDGENSMEVTFRNITLLEFACSQVKLLFGCAFYCQNPTERL